MYAYLEDGVVQMTTNKNINKEGFIKVEREDFTQIENLLMSFGAKVDEKTGEVLESTATSRKTYTEEGEEEIEMYEDFKKTAGYVPVLFSQYAPLATKYNDLNTVYKNAKEMGRTIIENATKAKLDVISEKIDDIENKAKEELGMTDEQIAEIILSNL